MPPRTGTFDPFSSTSLTHQEAARSLPHFRLGLFIALFPDAPSALRRRVLALRGAAAAVLDRRAFHFVASTATATTGTVPSVYTGPFLTQYRYRHIRFSKTTYLKLGRQKRSGTIRCVLLKRHLRSNFFKKRYKKLIFAQNHRRKGRLQKCLPNLNTLSFVCFALLLFRNALLSEARRRRSFVSS